jgi:hypothetical protein
MQSHTHQHTYTNTHSCPTIYQTCPPSDHVYVATYSPTHIHQHTQLSNTLSDMPGIREMSFSSAISLPSDHPHVNGIHQGHAHTKAGGLRYIIRMKTLRRLFERMCPLPTTYLKGDVSVLVKLYTRVSNVVLERRCECVGQIVYPCLKCCT